MATPAAHAVPAMAAVRGAGLGLRRELLAALAEAEPGTVDFVEFAPENWMQTGGRAARQFRACLERHRPACHGLSLSLGGPAALDEAFIGDLKRFLDRHGIADYSEHLSWCSDGHGQLYDLAPIPFTEEAVHHVAGRIRRVQDQLERRIAIENISYYAAPGRVLGELEFINAVVDEAGCDLLLDVNNLHVNAINHGYDAATFLDGLPHARVRWIHVAGHHVEAQDLCIDTHGSAVVEPVWALLAQAYRRCGPRPTLLERDFDIPPLGTLLGEVGRIRSLQRQATALPGSAHG